MFHFTILHKSLTDAEKKHTVSHALLPHALNVLSFKTERLDHHGIVYKLLTQTANI